jgi:hypothetical protein
MGCSMEVAAACWLHRWGPGYHPDYQDEQHTCQPALSRVAGVANLEIELL